MDLQSLAFRTDLALLQRMGSAVEDRGTHLVVRTPDNPSYYWGNFLLLSAPPPDVAAVEHWKRVHHQEFPEARHVALGIDRPGSLDDDAALLRAAGMDVETVVAMTTDVVHPPERPPREAEVRPLAGDADWGQQVDLTVDGEDDAHYSRDFASRKIATYRELAEAGDGAWWGAFVDGRLVASLGIYALGDGLARFQSVKTQAAFRSQGLAGALVVAASRYAQADLGARTLVMAADPTYSAIRVYRAVGFTEGGAHLEATLTPGRT
jgi:RimJ/RimL family protein N-acetyltransferase